jgi:hypothetical protein
MKEISFYREGFFGMAMVSPNKDRLAGYFHSSYDIIERKRIIFYPRKTFQRNGIPSPRQYIAFNHLVGLFGDKNGFFNSNLSISDLRTDELVLVDEFSSYFQNRRVKITLITGYFLSTGKKKREKMILFLKGLAKNGFEIEIYTQDSALPNDFFNNDPDRPMLEKFIKINIIKYRIDIHYTMLEDLENKRNTHFFIEYPHTELHMFRLDIHFSYADISERLQADPEKVIKYLIHLRKGNIVEKFFLLIKEKFPFLSMYSPNIGLAIRL